MLACALLRQGQTSFIFMIIWAWYCERLGIILSMISICIICLISYWFLFLCLVLDLKWYIWYLSCWNICIRHLYCLLRIINWWLRFLYLLLQIIRGCSNKTISRIRTAPVAQRWRSFILCRADYNVRGSFCILDLVTLLSKRKSILFCSQTTTAILGLSVAIH